MVVTIVMPLRVVTISPAGLIRDETIVHDVDRLFPLWAGRWERTQAVGILKARTACGETIECVSIPTHQRLRPCQRCAKSKKERQMHIVLGGEWLRLQHKALVEEISEAFRKNGRSNKAYIVPGPELIELTPDLISMPS